MPYTMTVQHYGQQCSCLCVPQKDFQSAPLNLEHVPIVHQLVQNKQKIQR